MSYLEAIFLGLIQGLTEFLPVSSSGHMDLFKNIFHINKEAGGLIFDIAVHFATLLAIGVVMRKDIISLFKRPFQRFSWLLIVATVPAALAGVLLENIVDSFFHGGSGSLGIAFMITALALWFAESGKNNVKDLDRINFKDAGVIGLTQAIAVVPGISRSGSTLAAGLFCGLKKEAAMRFSFLMSIPVILGASVLDIFKLFKGSYSNVPFGPLFVGMIVAAISGYASIKFMLDLFRHKSLKVFAVYTFALGTLILLDQLVFHVFFDGLYV